VVAAVVVDVDLGAVVVLPFDDSAADGVVVDVVVVDVDVGVVDVGVVDGAVLGPAFQPGTDAADAGAVGGDTGCYGDPTW